MAYVSKELKAKIAPVVKELCKRYGVKASLAVHHHSSLVLNIKSGKIDFIANYNETCGPQYLAKDHIQVNTYWCHDHFTGAARDFLVAAVAALKGPEFFDHSDIQTDYFHCSHYVDINVGRWNKPYELTA